MTSQVEGAATGSARSSHDLMKVQARGRRRRHPVRPLLYFSTFLLKWITSAAGEQTRGSISISDPFSRDRSHANPPKSSNLGLRVQTDWSAAMNLLKSLTLEYTRQTISFLSAALPPAALCGSCCCQVSTLSPEELQPAEASTGRENGGLCADDLLMSGEKSLHHSLGCKWEGGRVTWNNKALDFKII